MSADEEKDIKYENKPRSYTLTPYWSSLPEKLENLNCQQTDLYGKEPNDLTCMKKFCKRKITVGLAVSILLGVLVITLIILLFSFVFSRRYNDANKQECMIIGDEKNVVMYNAKIKDFQCLHPEVKELHIISLESITPDVNEDFAEKVFLSNLTLSGAISEKWLHFFLKKFPNLRNLKYDEDNLCSYSLLGKNPALFPIHTFPQLRSLVIENANNKCPFTELVFSKWYTPVLENFRIESSDLKQVLFGHFHAFLARVTHTIQVIEILNSFLCNNCNIMDITFPNIKEIIIADPKEYNFDWDVEQ